MSAKNATNVTLTITKVSKYKPKFDFEDFKENGDEKMTNEEAVRIISKICPDYEDEEIEAKLIAIKAIKKQIHKPPIPDENATGIDGRPVPRCQVCGYALDLRMEQYCPCCGQRLTEYPKGETE